ncbi:hypothetical protein Tco_0854542 [Tanacetum coccineum]
MVVEDIFGFILNAPVERIVVDDVPTPYAANVDRFSFSSYIKPFHDTATKCDLHLHSRLLFSSARQKLRKNEDGLLLSPEVGEDVARVREYRGVACGLKIAMWRREEYIGELKALGG